MLINRIQDRRGKKLYFLLNLLNAKDVIDTQKTKKEEGFPKLNFNNQQVISEQTAYQITSILEGVVKRGTGKT